MERNYYNEGFESFLREKTDEYKLYPSDKVWGQIQRKLHPRRKWPFLAAALLLLGVGVGSRYMVEDLHTAPAREQGLGGKNASDAAAAPGLNETTLTTDHSAEQPATATRKLTVASLNPTVNYTRTPAPDLKVAGLTELPMDESGQSKPLAGALSQEIHTVPSAAFSPNSFIGPLGSRGIASIDKMDQNLPDSRSIVNPPSKLNTLFTQVGRVGRKTSWQIYFAPSVSYRKLVGQASKYSFPYSGFPYSANFGFAQDVNDAVRHRPAPGMELGTALLYPLSRKMRVKAGLQFNFNSYQVEAYSYVPEIAPFGSNGPGSFANTVNTTAYYRNFNGFDRTMLKNSRFMIALPLGLEFTLLGNDRIKFNVASTIQPTYVINNEAYLVSTNLKNYAQEPSLYRKWNVNAGAEAFLSVNTGSYSWVIGPQFRYQILSSYKNKYPIKEHLVDYGFKIGVNKRLR